jgi:hypothetical protein
MTVVGAAYDLQAELEDQVQISTSFEDLCDQNVIVYLLRIKGKEYMPQVLQPVQLNVRSPLQRRRFVCAHT